MSTCAACVEGTTSTAQWNTSPVCGCGAQLRCCAPRRKKSTRLPGAWAMRPCIRSRARSSAGAACRRRNFDSLRSRIAGTRIRGPDEPPIERRGIEQEGGKVWGLFEQVIGIPGSLPHGGSPGRDQSSVFRRLSLSKNLLPSSRKISPERGAEGYDGTRRRA